MEINKQQVADRIKKIRINKGMTLEEFGKLFGASKSSVLGWETQRSLPNPERLKQIAKIGEISVDELLYGDDLEKIINLAHEIINNNIKNNYDQEYKFFYNPRNFNDLCLNVFTELSKQNALKENFNEYNVKDFINRKAKEMLRTKAFFPPTNQNFLNYIHDQLKHLINDIESYASIPDKIGPNDDQSKNKYSLFISVDHLLPRLYYNKKRIHPDLSFELVNGIEKQIDQLITDLNKLNASDYPREIDNILNDKSNE